MPLISLRQLLDHAADHGYGLPAFNVNNMEQVKAIMDAAAASDSPVVLQGSAGARSYAGEPFLRHLILAALELVEKRLERMEEGRKKGKPPSRPSMMPECRFLPSKTCSIWEFISPPVKCAKTDYGIKTSPIKECSILLGQELSLFPRVEAFLLMGDVAIKAINTIAERAGEGRVIPAGPTYKIRGQTYFFHVKRAFPSYLQAGPSFFIEKSKRRMIAEDIASAMCLVK